MNCDLTELPGYDNARDHGRCCPCSAPDELAAGLEAIRNFGTRYPGQPINEPIDVFTFRIVD